MKSIKVAGWLTAITLFCSCFAFARPVAADASQTATFQQQVVELVNAERAKNGAGPLKIHTNLVTAAMWMANDMASKDYFSHTDSLGRKIGQRIPSNGYTNFSNLGENIAAGQLTPEEVMDGWMNSPGHRANLLNPVYNEIGIGYAENPNSMYGTYWVQEFGARFSNSPVIINSEAASTALPVVSLAFPGNTAWTDMRLSNDGVNWTAWVPFMGAMPWTLASGPKGTRTVYVQTRNADGTNTVSDTIELTQDVAVPVAPTATSVPPTATSVPPTATSVPPTATRVPPTATRQPTSTPRPGETSQPAPAQDRQVFIPLIRF